ncbi:hypothetical protein ACU4GD_31775 [Cupriavidus basilensis]
MVPGPGVVLADGTLFPVGKTLNYALPIQATTMAPGTMLACRGHARRAAGIALPTPCSGPPCAIARVTSCMPPAR